MRFDPPLIRGTLVSRYKRFFADVDLPDGRRVTAHCANPGSMLGCLPLGGGCWLTPHTDPARKLAYSLELVEVEGTLVGVNTARPNRLVEEALRAGRVPGFEDPGAVRREAVWSKETRFDFQLTSSGGEVTWLEVKNVSVADRGVAYFPDSVTDRGTRHLRELSAAVRSGARACLLFWVHRGDVRRVRPARWIDPIYAAQLERSVRDGVKVIAIQALVTHGGIEAGPTLDLDLSPMNEWDSPPRWITVRPSVAATVKSTRTTRTIKTGKSSQTKKMVTVPKTVAKKGARK